MCIGLNQFPPFFLILHPIIDWLCLIIFSKYCLFSLWSHIPKGSGNTHVQKEFFQSSACRKNIPCVIDLELGNKKYTLVRAFCWISLFLSTCEKGFVHLGIFIHAQQLVSLKEALQLNSSHHTCLWHLLNVIRWSRSISLVFGLYSTQIRESPEKQTDRPLFLVLGKVSCELNWVILLWQMTGPLKHIQCLEKKKRKWRITFRKGVTFWRGEYDMNSQMAALSNNHNPKLWCLDSQIYLLESL